MGIKNFLLEIEKGLRSPVYFLYANNHYLLEEAISAVRKTVHGENVDFNFNIFDLDSDDGTLTPEQITDTLNTIPFWGKRRFVIVKNFQKLQSRELKKFQTYIANPSPDAVLLMFHAGTIKKEVRENLKGTKTICLDIREQELHFWLREKAKQKGVELKDDAIEYLIGTVGTDLGLLSSELEKLALIGSEASGIDDIREIVEGSRDYSVFDLTKALREKNAEEVFKIYRVLAETTEPPQLLGAINWQYSRMKADDRDSHMDHYWRAVELLNDADIRIKTSGSAYPMEYLLVRLLQL